MTDDPLNGDALLAAIADENDLDKKVNIALAAYSKFAESDFKAGRRRGLLQTMAYHLLMGEPIPEWARVAFLRAFYSSTKSWDDVFGKPRKDGQQVDQTYMVAVEAKAMLREKKRKVDESFFEDIATRLKMKPGTVKRRYYSEHGRRLARIPTEATTEADRRLAFALTLADCVCNDLSKDQAKMRKNK